MSCLISSQVLILPTCLILLTHSDFLKYWKRTWNWRYGNCYTFNSGATEDGKKTPVLTSTKPGPQYGNGVICFIVNLLEEIGKLVQIQLTTFPQGLKLIDQLSLLFFFLSGLTLDLFVNQGEYIPSISQEAGVRILLTPQRSIPFPVDEGFTVSPGFSTSIGLRQVCVAL